MSKYINADELIKALEKYMAQIENSKNFVYTRRAIGNMQMLVDRLPAADVVDVVRCKDCKYFDVDGLRGRQVDGQDVCMCKKFYNYPFLANEYCSRGERRKHNDKG